MRKALLVGLLAVASNVFAIPSGLFTLDRRGVPTAKFTVHKYFTDVPEDGIAEWVNYIVELNRQKHPTFTIVKDSAGQDGINAVSAALDYAGYTFVKGNAFVVVFYTEQQWVEFYVVIKNERQFIYEVYSLYFEPGA